MDELQTSKFLTSKLGARPRVSQPLHVDRPESSPLWLQSAERLIAAWNERTSIADEMREEHRRRVLGE